MNKGTLLLVVGWQLADTPTRKLLTHSRSSHLADWSTRWCILYQ